jgi:hypothetical protein
MQTTVDDSRSPRLRPDSTRHPAIELGRCTLLVCSVVGCVYASTASALADPAVYQSFDGPDTTWQLLDPRPGVQILAHGCVPDDAREGTGSERVTVTSPAGESVHFACPVRRIQVLDELDARMWVKSSRAGVMLGARVLLPRTIDPATHRPKTVLIEGTKYDQVDGWQQLSLAGVPKQLAARVRVLRTVPGGENIDPHEAYLDAVTLIVPGGPGAAVVWTDELVVDGVVQSVADSATTSVISRAVQTAFVAAGDPTSRVPLVQVQDTTLFVSGKPFLPRGIQWNGEPLAFLAERGFNTVWIDRPPTPQQTAEAQRVDIWFVCTPPRPDALSVDGLGPSLDRVLAWHLGTPEEHEIDYYRGWAELVRQKDPLVHRPLLVAPQSDWMPCSRLADVVLASRPDAGYISAVDYAQWLDERAILARPGTPFWATVATQPSRRVCEQIKLLAPDSKSPPFNENRQIESLTRTAGIHGCRGFLFGSTTSLNAGDDISRRRALELEALNRSLQLLEPWLTLGKQVGRATATDSSTSATILQVERTRLLVLDARVTDVDISTKPSIASPPANVTFIVPGVPDSNQAFLLSPASLQPLASKRVAGGVQITVDRNVASMVLFTEDANVISNFRARVSRDGPKAARLERDLVAVSVKTSTAQVQHLKHLGVDSADYRQAIAAASSQIASSDALLNGGNFPEASRLASAAFTTLAQAADRERQKLGNFPPLTSLPFAACSDNIAAQFEFQTTMQSLRPAENKLSGGEFEDLAQLMQLGWEHLSHPLPGVEPKAELSPQNPHSGRYCLQLSAQAVPPAAAPQIIARPLVWITSPPIHVATGDILEIAGWIRVPKQVVGNLNGLTVTDSLGGPELAIHVCLSPEWQSFRLIRAVGESSDEYVSFALSGLGTASIDDVTVRVLRPPSARRLPITTVPPPATAAQSAGLPALSAPLNQR